MPAGWVPNQLLNQVGTTRGVITPEFAQRIEDLRNQYMLMGQEPPYPEVQAGADALDYLTELSFRGLSGEAADFADTVGVSREALNENVRRIDAESQARRSPDFIGRVGQGIGNLTRVGRGEVTGVGDFLRDTATLGAIGYGTTFLGGGAGGAGSAGGGAATVPATTGGTVGSTVGTTAGSAGTAGGIGTGSTLGFVPGGMGAGVTTAATPAIKGGAMALSGLDWANIGTSILGALGSREAGEDQADVAAAAAAGLERADIRAREDLQPFREAGGAALNPLVDFALKGPETDLERTEGFTNIQNSAAAGGKLRSGGTLKALTEFNSMLNARNRSARFNELFNLAVMGSNAASRQATNTLNTAQGVGEYGTQGANAKAAGLVGGINQLSNLFDNFVFMRALNQGA